MSLMTTVIRTSTLTLAARLIADETLQDRPLELKCCFLPADAEPSMQAISSCHNVFKEPILTLPWQSLISSGADICKAINHGIKPLAQR